jgi:hypothetical protein
MFVSFRILFSDEVNYGKTSILAVGGKPSLLITRADTGLALPLITSPLCMGIRRHSNDNRRYQRDER